MQKLRISIITIRSTGNCLKGTSQQLLLKGKLSGGRKSIVRWIDLRTYSLNSFISNLGTEKSSKWEIFTDDIKLERIKRIGKKQITLGTGALEVRSCVTELRATPLHGGSRHRSASICLAGLNLQKQGGLFSFLLICYQERSTETENNEMRGFSKGWRDYLPSKCNRAHLGHQGEAQGEVGLFPLSTPCVWRGKQRMRALWAVGQFWHESCVHCFLHRNVHFWSTFPLAVFEGKKPH